MPDFYAIPPQIDLRGKAPRPPAERFWEKVDTSGECWIWNGANDNSGYGRIVIGSRANGTRLQMLAHRFSYILHFGAISDAIKVCHSCDTPSCVRPGHLFLGTQRDNVQDAVSKGRMEFQRHPERHQVGTQCPWSVLTEADVLEIRRRYAQGGISHRQLATSYGVSPSMIGSIVNYHRWKHVK